MTRILVLIALCSPLLQLTVGSPKIESALQRKASRNADSTANIIITLKSRPAQIREQISSKSYPQSSDRVTDLVSSLRANADATQAPIINLIQSSKYVRSNTQIKSLWISNQIAVRNADLHLLEVLSGHNDIESIGQEQVIHLDLPIDLKVQDSEVDEEEQSDQFTTADVSQEWNVDLIQAPLVWAAGYDGSGVIVANIDTGVRATHEALASNYKNDSYSWFDPYTKFETAYDDQGHGTHTMGTIVGTPETYGVGVAPGARWITCKGFDPDGLGWPAEILECGQFILCPHYPDGTNPDCSQRPHVVSNSWNSRDESATWFNEVIEAWHLAHIIPVHSNGNYGDGCCTVGSQAPRKVIAVGATTQNEEISWFSSRGPTYLYEVKPDISAPGQSIVSAYNEHDSHYARTSGTSMACPHVAGAAALLLSADLSLNFDQIKIILQATAERNLTFADEMCGDKLDSEFPNNHFGHGRLNVFRAYVRWLQSSDGAAGQMGPVPFSIVLSVIVSFLIANHLEYSSN